LTKKGALGGKGGRDRRKLRRGVMTFRSPLRAKTKKRGRRAAQRKLHAKSVGVPEEEWLGKAESFIKKSRRRGRKRHS